MTWKIEPTRHESANGARQKLLRRIKLAQWASKHGAQRGRDVDTTTRSDAHTQNDESGRAKPCYRSKVVVRCAPASLPTELDEQFPLAPVGLDVLAPVRESLATGPDRVVVASPALDDDLGLAQTVEDLAVEQLIAKASVEALAVAVLPGAAPLDVGGLRLTGRCCA
jgi:hypothetical protein